ncbi:hypothetical protein SAZ_40835 [Streptomyces noursei ZPM]|nr:hypothetical protein SAZ_40835 [Streptomyces noursei ZPM]
MVPGRSGSGSKRFPVCQPRLTGKSLIASVPESTRSHSCSGEPTPPGKRQAMPMMAIGSSSAAPVATGPATSRTAPRTSARR